MISIEQLYQIYLEHPIVSKDTRQNVNGAIYFAIKGANFDGNEFALDALSKGAAYAIIDDPSKNDEDNDRLILVENALETLQELATYHREKLQVPLLAITGSNGKTTTKELVSRVLGKKYNLYSTPGNYNNHIGIPLSILQIQKETEFVVLEMGASALGEIEKYCQIAQPDFGIITNIGRAHLEGFGSIEGVKKGKGELYDYLRKHDGLVFINLDEPYLEDMAEKVERRFLYCQSAQLQNDSKRFTAQMISFNPKVKCRFCDKKGNRIHIQSTLMGKHNFKNILTALAVGAWFGVTAGQMKEAIESYHSENNRSQIIERDSVQYLLDAYNANPSSMESMIRTFTQWTEGRKGLILGDMLELGAYSSDAHQSVVDLIKEIGEFDIVCLVGSEFGRTNCPDSFHNFKNVADLKEYLQSQDLTDMSILVKGSRSIQLEYIFE